MKKLVLVIVAMAMVSCATPVVNQVDIYGVVESSLYYNKHHHLKVWCSEKQKYYEIVTDRIVPVGETIRIK
jgi:hypothetical protein